MCEEAFHTLPLNIEVPENYSSGQCLVSEHTVISISLPQKHEREQHETMLPCKPVHYASQDETLKWNIHLLSAEKRHLYMFHRMIYYLKYFISRRSLFFKVAFNIFPFCKNIVFEMNYTVSAAEWMNQRIHQETLNVSNCKLVCLMCWRKALVMKGNPRLRPSLTVTLYTLLKIIVMSFSSSGWLTRLANEI